MATAFILVTAVGWITLGQLNRIGEVRADDAETTDRSGAPAPAPEIVVATPVALNEPGGLVTGPAGLPIGVTPTVISNRVFMVGDSVMQGAAPDIAAKLPKWSVVINTRVGRFLPEATAIVKTRPLKDLSDIVVLNLGNNYGQDRGQFRAQVDEMLSLLKNTKHIIWVMTGEFDKHQHEVNEVLRDAVDDHPNLVLLDWDTVWQKKPRYTSADDIHLTREGADAYASLIAAGLDRITTTAGETPAPHPAKPQINSRGQIPSSGPTPRKVTGYSPTTSVVDDGGSTTTSATSTTPARPSTSLTTTSIAGPAVASPSTTLGP